MYWLALIIVGLVISWIATVWYAKGKAIWGGWVTLLIASLLGSWLGDVVLGNWGWMIKGYNVIAGIIGALIISWLWALVAPKAGAQTASK
ncbi:MAG TPA: hypothetical protein GXX51_01530 [Firmicutes bacterium]|nr:hypothetical protein [Bacillota bacterium]